MKQWKLKARLALLQKDWFIEVNISTYRATRAFIIVLDLLQTSVVSRNNGPQYISAFAVCHRVSKAFSFDYTLLVTSGTSILQKEIR